ncbi:MAG: Mandelate racemase/muconate lactonizing protein [Deltaproteobacteria bacterium]|nr:Mandelate racemase/muconate lactonizing protein [Deltaproteobacteria bacterium]
MRLAWIDSTPFRIPFRQPLSIAGSLVFARVGLLVRAYSANGFVGIGEVAPPPLAGDQSIIDAVSAMASVQDTLRRDGPITIVPWLPEGWGSSLSGAVRAGVEMACCDLAARLEDRRVAELLGAAVHDEIPVNALIESQDPRTAADAVSALLAAGYRCFKLKVSHDLAHDNARVAAVRGTAGPGVRIRLDANGAWTVDEATAAITRLAAHGIEYVEQPVRTMEELARVRRAVGTPIAADECVTDANAVERLAALEAADVIVVKPALLGMRNAVAVIERARAHGLQVVVTSALDTSVGIAAALHLAATLPDPVPPCGLATAALLAGDLVREPLIPRAGSLALPRGAGLGVDLDEAAVERWSSRDNLHA